MVDYGPLKVHAIRGTNLIEVGNEQQQMGIPGACLILFTESDRRLVASVKTGADGRFEMKGIVPGRYRLIARLNGFCTANIPVEIIKSSRRKTQIVVHFRVTGLDDCSYGELAASVSGG
jgi:carboxypeptidase family protein